MTSIHSAFPCDDQPSSFYSSSSASSSSSSSSRTSYSTPLPNLKTIDLEAAPRHYIAVRNGHQTGVYEDWKQVERQILNHPEPVYKAFSTRLAAEAFVSGWDGSGRHSLPPSSPQPLREYLAMNFPSSVPLSSPSKSRSYHKTHLSTLPNLPAVAESSTMTDFGVPPLDSSRPCATRNSSSYRRSMVRRSSPLRQEVDDQLNVTSVMGYGGLLSPPVSPEGKKGSMIDRERPVKPRTAENAGLWGSTPPRPITPVGLGISSTPGSPTSTISKHKSIRGHPVRSASAPAGLWADTLPSPPPTPDPNMPELPHIPDGAPKFSRSALKRSSVVMPVRRPSTSSTSSSVLSRSSLSGFFTASNSSFSSIGSTGSANSDKTIHRSTSASTLHSLGQDRLATLAETSKAELKLNDAGLLALSVLSPPKPAYMRTTSSSSISSNNSIISSDSSFVSDTTIESPVPVHTAEIRIEEEVGISCTKSDGDADGSIESSSIKKKGKGKGGLFKRFSKVLGMEKKVVPGSEGRRGSL